MKSLKLNQLDSQRLAEKEMLNLTGGLRQYTEWNAQAGCYVTKCTCACLYEDKGGSSTVANGDANAANRIIPSYTIGDILGPYYH